MDRFAKIKQSVGCLRQVYNMTGAPNEAPTLEFCEWLIVEVERLHLIEDSARAYARTVAGGNGRLPAEDHLLAVLVNNQRPNLKKLD